MAGMKAYATFDDYLGNQSARNQRIIRPLRKFVGQVAPHLAEAVKWGNGCWIGESGPVAYVYSDLGFVQFGFFRGSSLRDPNRLLEGAGRYVRHIKVHHPSEIDPRAFGALLRQAAGPPRGSLPVSRPRTGTGAARPGSPSALIDARIKALGDWRGEMLSRLRALVKAADPGVVEEWKWEVPVWSHDGLMCTGETYKKVVKVTFAKGASLKDPSGLFNSSLGGNTRRAIDFHEGDALNEKALKALIRAAVAFNKSSSRA